MRGLPWREAAMALSDIRVLESGLRNQNSLSMIYIVVLMQLLLTMRFILRLAVMTVGALSSSGSSDSPRDLVVARELVLASMPLTADVLVDGQTRCWIFSLQNLVTWAWRFWT